MENKKDKEIVNIEIFCETTDLSKSKPLKNKIIRLLKTINKPISYKDYVKRFDLDKDIRNEIIGTYKYSITDNSISNILELSISDKIYNENFDHEIYNFIKTYFVEFLRNTFTKLEKFSINNFKCCIYYNISVILVCNNTKYSLNPNIFNESIGLHDLLIKYIDKPTCYKNKSFKSRDTKYFSYTSQIMDNINFDMFIKAYEQIDINEKERNTI